MHDSAPLAVRGPYKATAIFTPPMPVADNSPVPQSAIEVWEERIREALRRTHDSLSNLEQRLVPVSRSSEVPPESAPLESVECDLHHTFSSILSRVEENNHLLSRIHQNLWL